MTRVLEQPDRRVGDYGNGARPDRHMRVGHSDEVHHARNREYGTAAAEQSERQPDETARAGAKQILRDMEVHATEAALTGSLV